jgi:hypothetical protein
VELGDELMTFATREELAREYEHFRFSSDGIGGFIRPDMPESVFEQLANLGQTPLTKVQLNQLLVLSNTGSMSDGFFKYYWLKEPEHTYDITKLPYYVKGITNNNPPGIRSHDHLRWGLYRLYVDGLLYFGNVAAAYRCLRSNTFDDLSVFFQKKRFDTYAISTRGPALPLEQISKDDRYLISEMACKTFGEIPDDKEQARQLLLNALKKHSGPVTFRQLLDGAAEDGNREQLLLSYDDVLNATITSEEELNRKFNE